MVTEAEALSPDPGKCFCGPGEVACEQKSFPSSTNVLFLSCPALGGLFCQISLDSHCLAGFPPRHALLTHAASLGSALTSVCWDTATWQWGGATGSARERHRVKIQSWPHFQTNFAHQGRQVSGSNRQVHPWVLIGRPQEVGPETGECCLTRRTFPLANTWRGLCPWPPGPLTKTLGLSGEFFNHEIDRTTFLGLLDPGLNSNWVNSWNPLMVSGYCWLILINFHIRQFQCVCVCVFRANFLTFRVFFNCLRYHDLAGNSFFQRLAK